MTDVLRAQFVVYREVRWAGFNSRRYFLKYLEPMNPPEEGDGAVEELLYEVRVDAIPSDFDFPHKDTDAKSSGPWSEEGIEVEVFGENRLELGQVIEMQLIVIGNVGFK